jgi:hypothetical protein
VIAPMLASPAHTSLQAGTVPRHLKDCTRGAVLPPAILACSSSGTPARISARIFRDWRNVDSVRIIRAPHHVVDADDVAQANAIASSLEARRAAHLTGLPQTGIARDEPEGLRRVALGHSIQVIAQSCGAG